jgi:glucokinase
MLIAAIDFGGTLTKVGIVRGDQVLSTQVLESRSQNGLAPQLQHAEESIRLSIKSLGLSPSALDGVGIALPCIVDGKEGRVLSAPKQKFDDATSLDLTAWARQRLGVPLKIENDAHAALLGEWRFGAGRGVDDLVSVTLGTGIGTSVLIGGRALRGKHHQAGVLGGHFWVVPDGKDCPCGGKGCFETECGSRGLPERAKAHPKFGSSRLAREPVIDYEAVFRLAADGDAVAIDLRDRAIEWWGCVVVTLINAYDPQRVIVGGGVMQSAEAILAPLREAARRAWTPWGTVDVQGFQLGTNAILLGLSALFAHPLDCI